MLDQVRAFIAEHSMISPGDRVIVSVSGGPDSVSLLHLLHRVAPIYKAELHVFHLDHGLRAEESAADARYVRELAGALDLPSTVVGLGPEVLKRLGGSLQAAARAVRLDELNRLSQRLGGAKVAQGHNLNDQAETVLMRLLRGAGPSGLSGILPVRTLDGVRYIRPLLATSRAEIEQYCRDFELSPRQDESNLRPDYLRNRLRLELLPLLTRSYNPALPKSLAQVATVLQAEDALLDDLAQAALDRCTCPGDELALLGSALGAEPLAVARRVVRLAAERQAGVDLGLSAVTAILHLAGRPEGSQVLTLTGGLTILAEYGRLRFLTEPGYRTEALIAEWPVSPIGVTEIAELGLIVEGTDQAPETAMPTRPTYAAFDAELLPGPLMIRLRQPGDRIWPVGMEGSKKLQDILVDAKVPRRLRNRLPVLVAGSEVIWLIGYRLDRRFLAGPTTKRSLFVRVLSAAAEA